MSCDPLQLCHSKSRSAEQQRQHHLRACPPSRSSGPSLSPGARVLAETRAPAIPVVGGFGKGCVSTSPRAQPCPFHAVGGAGYKQGELKGRHWADMPTCCSLFLRTEGEARLEMVAAAERRVCKQRNVPTDACRHLVCGLREMGSDSDFLK